MEQSFGLLFHLKKHGDVKSGKEFPVYMRITVDGQYCEISTKRKCNTSIWNADSGRQVGKTDSARHFNAYLDTLQQKVFEAKRKLIELDKALAAENIKNLLLGKTIDRPKHMLMEIFKHHNDQITALVNRDFAPGTIERYITSYNHLIIYTIKISGF